MNVLIYLGMSAVNTLIWALILVNVVPSISAMALFLICLLIFVIAFFTLALCAAAGEADNDEEFLPDIIY